MKTPTLTQAHVQAFLAQLIEFGYGELHVHVHEHKVAAIVPMPMIRHATELPAPDSVLTTPGTSATFPRR